MPEFGRYYWRGTHKIDFGGVDDSDEGATESVESSGSGSGSNSSSTNAEPLKQIDVTADDPKGQSDSFFQNPLKTFVTYNTIVSFMALSVDEINNPKETFHQEISNEEGIIVRSGGADDNKVSTLSENFMGVNVEYFIDDLEIDAILAPGKRNKQSRATTVSFKVHEPYSAGLFLQTLQIAAEKKGHDSYIDTPFLLKIDFEGWDDYGSYIGPGDTNTTRLVPIQLVNATFEIEASGSVYEVQAIPWGEQPFTDEIQTLDSDFEVTGRSVKEILSISNIAGSNFTGSNATGTSSLMASLNSDLLSSNEEEKRVNQKDEYAILFPTDIGRDSIPNIDFQPSSSATRNTDENKKDNIKQSRSEFLGINTSTDIGVQSYEISINQAVSEFLSSKTNSNDIGNSSINFDSVDEERKPFINPDEARNVERLSQEDSEPLFEADVGQNESGEVEVWRRNKMVIDRVNNNFLFEKGMRIQDIIEELIIISEYGNKLLQEESDKNGMRPWFFIQTETFIIPDAEFETANGRQPRLYVFNVIPYMVHESHFASPTKKPQGYEELKKQVPREYNYIYTGQNDDIIDFNIDINYAFYKMLQADLGNNTNDSKQMIFNQSFDNGEEPRNKQNTGDTRNSSLESGKSGYPSDPSTGKKGGAVNEDRKKRVARAYNEAVINSEVDLINLSLGIWGDPFFIPDTGIGNYNAGFDLFNITKDDTINYQSGEVDLLLNFRTPVDINDNGFLNIGSDIERNTTKVQSFSGLYMIIKITSQISGNKFTQSLELVRRTNQDLIGDESSESDIVQEDSNGRRGRGSVNDVELSQDLPTLDDIEERLIDLIEREVRIGEGRAGLTFDPDNIRAIREGDPERLVEIYNRFAERTNEINQVTRVEDFGNNNGN